MSQHAVSIMSVFSSTKFCNWSRIQLVLYGVFYNLAWELRACKLGSLQMLSFIAP